MTGNMADNVEAAIQHAGDRVNFRRFVTYVSDQWLGRVNPAELSIFRFAAHGTNNGAVSAIL